MVQKYLKFCSKNDRLLLYKQIIETFYSKSAFNCKRVAWVKKNKKKIFKNSEHPK